MKNEIKLEHFFEQNPLFVKIKNSIKSFEQLTVGWDGYSAPAIPKKVISNTLMILESVKNITLLPEVFPTPRESIQLEYDKGERSLEIEVFGNHFEVAIFKDTNLEIDKSLNFDEIGKINQFIVKFI
jgi:hypothetical protein